MYVYIYIYIYKYLYTEAAPMVGILLNILKHTQTTNTKTKHTNNTNILERWKWTTKQQNKQSSCGTQPCAKHRLLWEQPRTNRN